jgi:hypothetical protein
VRIQRAWAVLAAVIGGAGCAASAMAVRSCEWLRIALVASYSPAYRGGDAAGRR